MDRKLLVALDAELAAGRSIAMVTVIATKGSAPRHAGSSMLLLQDGSIRATVGGGQGEAEALEAAAKVLAGAPALLLEVDKLGADVAGSEGICGGVTTMLVQAINPASAMAASLESLLKVGGGVLVHALPGGGTFEDPLLVEDRLIICGGGHVGLALARLANEVDFAVTVVDSRPEFADSRRFPSGVEVLCGPYRESLDSLKPRAGDYAVVLTPGHKEDLVCVRALFPAGLRYLGCIGSARKTRMILEALKADGFDPSRVDAIFAPVGLDIGAETPGEIAVSILAELIAVRHGAVTLAAAVMDRARRRA
ncbi:MAG: XdhC family protein [Treponema sp.]|nr:XdhC family protein [Treponema sp.]